MGARTILLVLTAVMVGSLWAPCIAAFAETMHQKPSPGPAHVEVARTPEAGFMLLVDGEPYTVRGAGMGQPSEGRFKAFVEAGGNTIRTWSAREAGTVLALAEKYDVMVALGIDFGQELHGFDYDDPAAVAAQFESVRQQIDRYKDHPNLLLWIVGNELNLLYGEYGVVLVNPKVYAALNDVADYIHTTDTHHPVTTAFAGYLVEQVLHALPFMPDIDILSVQLYGDLEKLPDVMEADPSSLPVLLTEYGPTGHWEVPKTEWGREIEEPSAVKAEIMKSRINTYIVGDDSGRLIGDFAFFWGHKQERTGTWYSLFTENGATDARIDELTRYWTGKYPENRAPLTKHIRINGKTPVENIILEPGKTYTAKIAVSDPNGDPLRTKWAMRTEVVTRSTGGEYEAQPEIVPLRIISEKTRRLVFRAPNAPGEYRLYAVTSDPNDKIGTANAAILVRQPDDPNR